MTGDPRDPLKSFPRLRLYFYYFVVAPLTEPVFWQLVGFAAFVALIVLWAVEGRTWMVLVAVASLFLQHYDKLKNLFRS